MLFFDSKGIIRIRNINRRMFRELEKRAMTEIFDSKGEAVLAGDMIAILLAP